jgi:hypothetical protein
MRLRLDPAKGSQDAFSFALAHSQQYAASCGHPFSPKELWKVLREAGLSLEEGGRTLADGPESDAEGFFTAALALDHLYAQGILKRRLDPSGVYVYSGGT